MWTLTNMEEIEISDIASPLVSNLGSTDCWSSCYNVDGVCSSGFCGTDGLCCKTGHAETDACGWGAIGCTGGNHCCTTPTDVFRKNGGSADTCALWR